MVLPASMLRSYPKDLLRFIPTVHLDGEKFQIYRAPKTGTTSTWHWIYQASTGKQFCEVTGKPEGKIYGGGWREVLSPLDPNAKRIIVTRDPVERFISAYRDMTRRGQLTAPFDQVATVPKDLLNAKGDLTHHFQLQYHSFGLRASDADMVIPFSKLDDLRKMIEEAAGFTIDNTRRMVSPKLPLTVTTADLDNLMPFLQTDYDAGLCDEKPFDLEKFNSRNG
jgi:hypothetical protein